MSHSVPAERTPSPSCTGPASSGARSANGTSTKARSHMRGWGTTRSDSLTTRSPTSRTSTSRVLGPHRSRRMRLPRRALRCWPSQSTRRRAARTRTAHRGSFRRDARTPGRSSSPHRGPASGSHAAARITHARPVDQQPYRTASSRSNPPARPRPAPQGRPLSRQASADLATSPISLEKIAVDDSRAFPYRLGVRRVPSARDVINLRSASSSDRDAT